METIAKIEIEKLVFPHQDKPVLKNIDFEIQRGDFIVITGMVASGKSILLHTITGAIPHYHKAELTGKVTIMGQDIKEMRLNRMSDYVGYMMQEPNNQVIGLDVYEDVAFGLGNLGIPFAQIDETIKNTLDFVGLKGFESRQTTSLSGGEAQRVVLAGVLALNAPILILDQPTAELDPQGREELYKRLGQLNKTQNLTIVMVMDRIQEALRYANRVFYIEDGEITIQYSPEEYYKAQVQFQKARLNANIPFNSNNSLPKESVAEVTDVSYQYRNDLIGCEDINLKVYRGDFLSIVGLNGSGKSTLAKLLIGLLKPSKGEIKVFNQPLNKDNITEIRKRIGFLFQNPDYQIFAGTLEEEVGFSLKLRGEQHEVIEQKVNECLSFVGLLAYKTMHPQRLSRGQRQLLALASVLVSDPEFIIADEPTSGLDENQGYVIMDKLLSLAQKRTTILLITHDLTLAEHYSSRLAAMYNHRLYMEIPSRDLPQYLDRLKAIGLNFSNMGDYDETF
ncbi:ATPase component of various ABC-type transport systems with duplicated ATPase domain [Desulfosporosinus orientis DSM 765]|uniref:ATPase component of various ABC-type transport systems with duplicated ATPase domain n=1 Tax=Desulfosporosinus orientis (strain ATCC 19365 / DSM 765 / NCIMB 8382 / VKM B-1628 / Singapore I) TaxID=768706 RepID=G7WH41_DESOD|nr:ABC transporter ATP-binding protein [Desulfosporosinus orientis]AET69549.1 ATPase component of various ABC-type transport systems with duplicated ATPase domain [Desulfosporosinus orientis DSM 765]